jgi:hypothetical protein
MKKVKPKGRVDIRVMKKSEKARLRFYNVYPDQLETILIALKKARTEAPTHSDTVALEMTCLSFIATSMKKK